METRRLVNIILIVSWALLFLIVVLALFRDRLPDFNVWFASLRRSEETPARVFPRMNLTGFSLSFREADQLRFWRTASARAEQASGVTRAGDSWARVTFFPAISPSFHFNFEETGVTDWREVETFFFRVFNPQAWPVGLKVKIKDTAGNFFQRDLELDPFLASGVEIPVANVARRLDVGRIDYLNLFLWEPATETRLFFTDFSFLPPGKPPPSDALVNFSGLEFPRSVPAGKAVEASFYFTPAGRIGEDWELWLRLERGGTIRELKRVEIPFPTSRWRVGRLAKVGPLEVTIPENLPPGAYGLEVILARMLEPDGRRHYFQPYRNPELAGQRVATIEVTTPLPDDTIAE